jgi:hypothetical protein
MEWKNGKLKNASILSKKDSPVVIRYADRTLQAKTKAGQILKITNKDGLTID